MRLCFRCISLASVSVDLGNAERERIGYFLHCVWRFRVDASVGIFLSRACGGRLVGGGP